MQSIRHPKIILIAVLVVITIIIGVSYTFLEKTSESDYKAAATQVQSLQTTTIAINDKLDNTRFTTDINDTLVSDMKKLATQYNNTFNALSANPAVIRDQDMKAVYDQYKSTLASYGQSADKTIASVGVYHSLVSACGQLVDKINSLATLKDFDSAAKTCKDTITTAKSTPSTTFKDKFLGEYAALSSSLLDAYRQMFVQIDKGAKELSYDDINLIKTKISDFGNEINLSVVPDPTEALQKIKASISL